MPLRSRRAKQQLEPTRQFLTFQIRGTSFALAIESVQRVVPLGEVFPDPDHPQIRLTRYQDQTIRVLDGEQQLFGKRSRTVNTQTFLQKWELRDSQQYLLVLEGPNQTLSGLPITRQPGVRRIPLSKIEPVTQSHPGQNIPLFVQQMFETAEEETIFLIALDRFLS
ncbi:MAG: chemotaxis protein CheW [Leptolyngbyaceae cyanobacterium bins.59]|nr:chemotaxis protein CheW [Leptolyngbyaceae cyanobacterium bins.59]